MKRIALIDDGRPFWPRIRDLLAKVNAVVDEVPAGARLPTREGARPDLVVIGDAGAAAHPVGWWTGPLLVVEKGRDPELVTPIGGREWQLAVSSAIGERTLLSQTSRLLGVSERRLFCAVVGIKRAGQAHLHMGASREFSLTGLSFALPAELQPSERIVLSFYVPGARRRIALEAEVMRSFADPAEGARCYGARFVGLSADEQEVLRRFVWAEE